MKLFFLIISLLHMPLAAAPIVVAVSVPPQATLVKKVGGDKVQIITLIPPGASPHSYNLRPRQLTDISQAKLYVAVGSGFSFEQTWMDRITDINPKLKVIACTQHITTHTDHDHTDPHFWLSPRGCKVAIDNITKALTKTDPNSAHIYQANQKAYNAQLDSLNTWITHTLTNLKSRTFLVYHPAWTHFARDYNLTQLAIEHEGKDPTPRHMAHIISQAQKHNIRTIFTEPQFNSASAKTIAKEINGKVIHLDPLASDPIANLKIVTQAIATQHEAH